MALSKSIHSAEHARLHELLIAVRKKSGLTQQMSPTGSADRSRSCQRVGSRAHLRVVVAIIAAICLGLQASQALAFDIKIAIFNIKELGLTKASTPIA